MESDLFLTPSKIFNKSPTLRLLNGQKSNTPKSNFHINNINNYTPNSLQRKKNTFHVFNVINNTPPSRFPKIINPFEAALTERLHLPLICSPSLFRLPSTPQHSSTQFEWTIDEVSSLNPANVEPHETQFLSTTDPELEARAQAAINSYFKEQIIVPSPIDCQVGKKLIRLNNDSCASIQRKRDGICQTELTLPPTLPKDIELALMPYFNYTIEQQQSPAKECDNTIDHDARDASLRRKLFNTSMNTTVNSENINHNYELEGLSPPPKTPESTNTTGKIRNFGSPENCLQHSLNISISPVHENSFGSLSPISKLIHTPTPLTKCSKKNISYLSTSSIYRSTPERAISIYRSYSSNSVNMSVDCSGASIQQKFKSIHHTNMQTDDKNHSSDSTESEYDYECQMSLSFHGSQHQTTPTRGKQRIANRKNLSYSFLSTSEDDMEQQQPLTQQEIVDVVLCKVDSGFNEMDMSKNTNVQNQYYVTNNDVTMRTDD